MTIAALRIRAGYTQGEAAELLGISRATLARWEVDSRLMPIPYIDKFEELYQFPRDYTYYGLADDISKNIKAAYKNVHSA